MIGVVNNDLGHILSKENICNPINPFNPGKHYEEAMSVKRVDDPLLRKVFDQY
jgi:hypothetical protein